jgi:rhombotail lipoprotein
VGLNGALPSAFELPETAVAPRPERQQKRGAETPFAPAPVALHDFGALPDLAVVDPATHSLVLRAGGFDNRHGNVTLIDEPRRLREAAAGGFTAATKQMIDHFDTALTAFEADVHEGKANVRIVSNQRGSSGGGGSLDWLSLLVLVPLTLLRVRRLRGFHSDRS